MYWQQLPNGLFVSTLNAMTSCSLRDVLRRKDSYVLAAAFTRILLVQLVPLLLPSDQTMISNLMFL